MDRLDTILKSIDEATDGAGANLCPEEKFIISMGKLLTVGAFYPAQHTRSQDVGNKVRSALAKLTSSQNTLCMEIRSGGIQLQNTYLANDIPAVNQWHELLDQLAISSLLIEKDISALNLHHLATGLLTLKLATDSAHGFVTPDFGNLPQGVTVTPREFGHRAENEDIAQKIMQIVDDSLARINDGDSSTAEHQEYRELMELFFASIVERLEQDRSALGAQNSLSQRPLDEVLQLGSHAIGHALQAMEEKNGELSQLPQLFENAEFALAYSSDGNTIELMVDVLHQAVSDLAENVKKKDKWIPDPTDYKLSLEQLENGIQQLGTEAEPYTNLSDASDGEFLSISLEILTVGYSNTAFQRTTRYLADLLSGRLDNEEFSILIESTNNILRHSTTAEIDNLIPYLVSPIHRSGPEKEFRFWQGLCGEANESTRKAMWPHIALHLFKDKMALSQTNTWHQWVSSLSREEMAKQLPRLEALRGFNIKRFNQKLFTMAPVGLHNVFSVLMESSLAHNLGPWLHEGIAKQSNQNLPKIILAACREYETSNQRLYQLLLAESRSQNPSSELKTCAASTLETILSDLPVERQEEPWVAPALAAFGALNPIQARPLLEKVISEKRMKMFYLWPDKCRQSAKNVLKRMDGGR